MRRVYRDVHIGLISALLLAVIAFEAGAAGLLSPWSGDVAETRSAR
ncbi:hypothetical protein [Tropicimonas sp. IMCC6043]|nr:hypothetical protein [Tropicimonas sp. IMCC6043]